MKQSSTDSNGMALCDTNEYHDILLSRERTNRSTDDDRHGLNLTSRSTQPGHPFVGRRNEYQPKGGDALRLGSKGRYGSCVGGR